MGKHDLGLGAFSVMPLALDREARDFLIENKDPDYAIRRKSDGAVVFESWTLWEHGGKAVEMHVMRNPDDPGCFHSHPADRSMRMVVEGGYVEQREGGDLYTVSPGTFSEVRHDLSHRIDRVLGERSVSLWWRGVRRHEIRLTGPGW